MPENNLPQTGSTGFEGLKKDQRLRGRVLRHRDLQSLLGYKQWRRFENAGYKGLYGGLGAEAIKARKRIPEKEQLMDRMDTTELAANQFRMTQTRDKLARQAVHHQDAPSTRTSKSAAKSARRSNASAARCPRTCRQPNILSKWSNESSKHHRSWHSKAQRRKDCFVKSPRYKIPREEDTCEARQPRLNDSSNVS